MRIAVTGSQGFVGREAVKILKSHGHQVIECTRENCDLLDKRALSAATRGASVVVHCAAVLEDDSEDIFEVNVGGTENLLEACANNRISHFIFLSSVGVYGRTRGEKNEESETAPETMYEKSKLEAEKKVLAHQELFNVTILRPAIVLGDNKYWKRIVKTIKNGFPLIGSGENNWQMVCVHDVADAILFCIGNGECYGETFIVAEQEAMTLEETVRIIRTGLGLSGEIHKIPVWLGRLIAFANRFLKFNPLLKQSYIDRLLTDRKYSVKKIMKAGWEPKCSAREELSQLVADIVKSG